MEACVAVCRERAESCWRMSGATTAGRLTIAPVDMRHVRVPRSKDPFKPAFLTCRRDAQSWPAAPSALRRLPV